MGLSACIIISVLISSAFTQMHNLEKPESCSVICNCNIGQQTEPPQSQSSISKGPKGDRGPQGLKGQKGDAGKDGSRRQESQLPVSYDMAVLSATSCQELKSSYDINTTGYYLLRDEATNTPAYNYCDFTMYADVNTCQELFEKLNTTKAGYYLFATGNASARFQLCPSVFTGIYTCQGLQDRYALTKSGYYKVQSPGGEPFRVYCNFDRDPVVTEIRHNIIGERAALPACESAGCYIVAPVYELSQSDIIKIIDNSDTCSQFIKLKCKGSLIKNNAWWISRNGEKMFYWGGTNRNGYCACGESGTCIDNSYKCNCDQNSANFVTSDEGYLIDKTKLPVKEMKLGDMGDTGEAGWYTIGILECIG